MRYAIDSRGDERLLTAAWCARARAGSGYHHLFRRALKANYLPSASTCEIPERAPALAMLHVRNCGRLGARCSPQSHCPRCRRISPPQPSRDAEYEQGRWPNRKKSENGRAEAVPHRDDWSTRWRAIRVELPNSATGGITQRQVQSRFEMDTKHSLGSGEVPGALEALNSPHRMELR